MPHRSWAEQVEHELARRGVPAGYRRRLLAELRDHADDLMEEEGSSMQTEDVSNTRLGDPAALAEQAAMEYRRSRWASRHPLLAFGVLPLPAILLAMVATLLLFDLAAESILWWFADAAGELPRSAMIVFAYAMAWSVRFVPFVLLAAAFTRPLSAKRQRRESVVVRDGGGPDSDRGRVARLVDPLQQRTGSIGMDSGVRLDSASAGEGMDATAPSMDRLDAVGAGARSGSRRSGSCSARLRRRAGRLAVRC